MNNKLIKYATNLCTYFGASLIPMALNLVSNPWIAKNMAPEDYAVSGYYTSFSSLISPIILFYMIHYYIKEYFRVEESGRKELFATIAKALIWFSGAVSIICFIILFGYLALFNDEQSMPIMPYLGLMVFSLPLTGLLNLQLAQYRMEKKSRSFFILSVSNGVLNICCSVLFVVFMKWGAFGKLLGPLVCNLSVFTYMVWRYRTVWCVPTQFSQFRKIFVFCMPLTVGAMLGYFFGGFTTTYLESVGQIREYGIYIVGASMAAYLTTFSTAINNTFQPDLYESVIKKQWGRYFRVVLVQIAMVLCVATAFIVVAPYVISLLTAGRYVDSTPYARILALSTVTSSIYYLINNFSITTNKPKLYLYTTILGAIFMVVAVPMAVDRWTFIGGAWINVISYIVFALINLALLGMVRVGIIPKKLQ